MATVAELEKEVEALEKRLVALGERVQTLEAALVIETGVNLSGAVNALHESIFGVPLGNVQKLSD